MRVNWRWLNKNMAKLTEAEVERYLGIELAGECRGDIVIRLHQRLNSLRVARERQELLEQMKNGRVPDNHAKGQGT